MVQQNIDLVHRSFWFVSNRPLISINSARVNSNLTCRVLSPFCSINKAVISSCLEIHIPIQSLFNPKLSSGGVHAAINFNPYTTGCGRKKRQTDRFKYLNCHSDISQSFWYQCCTCPDCCFYQIIEHPAPQPHLHCHIIPKEIVYFRFMCLIQPLCKKCLR